MKFRRGDVLKIRRDVHALDDGVWRDVPAGTMVLVTHPDPVDSSRFYAFCELGTWSFHRNEDLELVVR